LPNNLCNLLCLGIQAVEASILFKRRNEMVLVLLFLLLPAFMRVYKSSMDVEIKNLLLNHKLNIKT
jgi:hypothetical protein